MTKADDRIICDGGGVSAGACVCPAGFGLRPAGDSAAGGTCVKTNAENCLGGELTVSGTCQCNAQVVMSGETYELEFVRGKCVPKRCPLLTIAKDGKCVSASAASDGIEADTNAGATPPKASGEEASDDDEHPHHCGQGMIRTRSGSGCVSTHRRHSGFTAPADVGGYRGYVTGSTNFRVIRLSRRINPRSLLDAPLRGEFRQFALGAQLEDRGRELCAFRGDSVIQPRQRFDRRDGLARRLRVPLARGRNRVVEIDPVDPIVGAQGIQHALIPELGALDVENAFQPLIDGLQPITCDGPLPA
jgi:hypothetical protein